MAEEEEDDSEALLMKLGGGGGGGGSSRIEDETRAKCLAFVKAHNLRGLLKQLMEEIVLAAPEDPLAYLVTSLEKKVHSKST